MTNKISLDALLRRISRDAEKIFNANGELDMIWIIENIHGQQSGLCTPVTDEIKPYVGNIMRSHFAAEKVTRYAYASEATTTIGEPKEIVALYAGDRRQELFGVRNIIRPRHGHAYLDKLKIHNVERTEGRLANLLPRIDHLN